MHYNILFQKAENNVNFSVTITTKINDVNIGGKYYTQKNVQIRKKLANCWRYCRSNQHNIMFVT